MQKVTFNKGNFNTILKFRIEEYFRLNNIPKTGNRQLYLKSFVLITSALLVYALLLWGHLPAIAGIALCILLGVILAGIGFNIMHDAGHGSYSSKKWLNDLMSLSLNGLGGNAFLWKRKHNILHHTYTNIEGMDDDIAKSPILRQCEQQRWVPAHRYQHFYSLPLYAFSGVFWIVVFDFTKYLKRKISHMPITKITTTDHLIFWLSKILYIFFYVALPIMLVGTQAWLVGYLCMNATMGLIMALVFQCAHVVGETEFKAAGLEPRMLEDEWAVHQVKSTVNFAPGNKILTWYAGGLNYQIEHHLFPRISHVHYPGICGIIEKACKEFDLPYYTYPTFTSALVSHFTLMKELGKKPVAESNVTLARAV